MSEVLRRYRLFSYLYSFFFLTILVACNVVVAFLVWNIMAFTFNHVMGLN